MKQSPVVEFSSWQAVELAAEVWRCLWLHAAGLSDAEGREGGFGQAVGGLRVSDLHQLVHNRTELDWVADDILGGLLAQCREKGLLTDSGETLSLTGSAFSLLEWLEKIFSDGLNTEDLLYIAAANVRARNCIRSNVTDTRLVQDGAAAMRDCFRRQPANRASAKTILSALPVVAGTAITLKHERQRGAALGLIEAAMLFGALRPVTDVPHLLELCGNGLDADYLLHCLFGLHTSISGFDELFEGGLLLADKSAEDQPITSRSGRVIVARGRFGTGKSTLALLIGAEVARKGGFVWYYSIEESVRQRRHALETLMVNEGRELFQILDIPEAVSKRLGERQQMRVGNPQWRAGQGLFSFYIANAITYDSLMKPLDIACSSLVDYGEPLTLMVVDPLNAVLRNSADDDSAQTSRASLRANTVEILTSARRNGANVLLVCEEETETETDIQFMENIADTVINLTVESHKDCRQRFLEISKSRYQKETGGKHAFNIEKGPSLRIFPSSASFAVRYGRCDESVRRPTDDSFGLTGLDQVLGAEAVFRRGDAFAVVGPSESLRRILAFNFLLSGLGANGASERPSDKDLVLLLTTRDDERSLRDTLSQLQRQGAASKPLQTLDACVRVCLLPRGYVQPGYVFQRLQAEFDIAARNGQTIRRVVLDDVAYLEMTCPFIREDEIFGTALLGFLSQHEATALFVCNDTSDGRSGHLQTSIVDGAQTVIQLGVCPSQGAARTGLRVTRTRTMRHGHGNYELVFDENGLRVETGSLCNDVQYSDV